MTHSHQGDIIVVSMFLTLALLFVLIGWSIKFNKQVSFIAGYDENTCKDKDGLANHVGGSLLITGILGSVLTVTALMIPVYAKQIVGIYIVSVCIGSVITASGAKKFLKAS